MFLFDRNKINFDEVIGVGGYGAVYPYRKDPQDNRWVVKVQTVRSECSPGPNLMSCFHKPHKGACICAIRHQQAP